VRSNDFQIRNSTIPWHQTKSETGPLEREGKVEISEALKKAARHRKHTGAEREPVKFMSDANGLPLILRRNFHERKHWGWRQGGKVTAGLKISSKKGKGAYT